MAKAKKSGSARKRKKPRRRKRDSWLPPYAGAEPGAPPGTLHVDPEAPEPEIYVIAYGPTGSTEAAVEDPADLRPYMEQWPVTWVNVEGLGNADKLQAIADMFGIHPLALEDVVHVNQRSKGEQYTGQLFVVTHMAEQAEGVHITTEQIALVVGKGYVISFQERPGGDCLDPVRRRIRQSRGRIRRLGSDYLAYALIDAVVDHYFPVVEDYGEHLGDLEKDVLARPSTPVLARVLEARRDLLWLRRLVWPMREMVAFLSREDQPLVTQETRVFLRDTADHVTRLIEAVESYREISSGLLDVYMSSASHRMNEVMKVLTIIATIFIPLSFIAGVYGMNFDTQASPYNMPELDWRYGYFATLGLMTTVALGLVYYFWRRGWLKDEGDVRKAIREADKDSS